MPNTKLAVRKEQVFGECGTETLEAIGGYQIIVLDADAKAFGGDVYAWLDRDHISRRKRRLGVADIVDVQPEVMAQAMRHKRIHRPFISQRILGAKTGGFEKRFAAIVESAQSVDARLKAGHGGPNC